MTDTITQINNSTYLEFSSYSLLPAGVATTVQEAYGLSNSQVKAAGPTDVIHIALVLDRANDPTTDLLANDWGTRQQMLASMTEAELWETYGTKQKTFDDIKTELEDGGYTILGNNPGTTGAYVTSAESRTIWLELTASQFETLFSQQLMRTEGQGAGSNFVFWNGELSLPESIAKHLDGLWVDSGYAPDPVNLAGTVSSELEHGPQSIGNSTTAYTGATPSQVADLYNFPLDGEKVETGLIGLIEPGIGTALNDKNADFQYLLDYYETTVGVTGDGVVYTQGTAGQGNNGGSGERSLDFGTIGGINPNSDIVAYVGSGLNGGATSTIYTAYQASTWLTGDGQSATDIAPVVSSSWSDDLYPAPGSPFYNAYVQLLVDSALANQTQLNALGDGGSGDEVANGLPNVFYPTASPYMLQVGGSSIATASTAAADTTLADLWRSAQAQDQGTIWELVRSGLKSAPTQMDSMSTFVETVWNTYYVEHDKTITSTTPLFEGNYQSNSTGSGGVDTTQATPSYQTEFGLTPTDVQSGLTGRGLPDISGLAGGDLNYIAPTDQMDATNLDGGTSAATPMWASLISQFNAIFNDQGLPNLGYMNDLLYLAAAVAPGSFNDITMGNDTSSYYLGGHYKSDGQHITPTGYGYEASEGYDLASGLGSPNGLLLARSLTAIAHAQMYYDPTPVLETSGSDWTSTAAQSLMFQASSALNEDISLNFSKIPTTLTTTASAAYAWTSQFAQQSLQSDFSADLVTLFDGQAQGTLYQAQVADGADVAISIGGTAASAIQAALTADYGFVDFANANGSVEVARPVAVALTAGGADDMDVVVRLRQNGMNDSSLTLYKVDDYAGTIGGLAPGSAGYAAAAAARAYETDAGTASITGAGYGQYSQTEIVGVDHGDIIAMSLTSAGHTYWAFAQANEQVSGQNVAHLWSYGLNTFGWEDLYGGGDHDYNDLVVQLDFTSATGHDWLV